MAVNTKDKSVINYLQMISYPLQLFAHQIAMPSTAAQMHQLGLVWLYRSHPHPPTAPKLPQEELGQAKPQTGRMNCDFPVAEDLNTSTTLGLLDHMVRLAERCVNSSLTSYGCLKTER